MIIVLHATLASPSHLSFSRSFSLTVNAISSHPAIFGITPVLRGSASDAFHEVIPEWLESCGRSSSWRNRARVRRALAQVGLETSRLYTQSSPEGKHALTIDPGEPSSIHERGPVPGRRTAWLYLVSGTNQCSWRARGNGDGERRGLARTGDGGEGGWRPPTTALWS